MKSTIGSIVSNNAPTGQCYVQSLEGAGKGEHGYMKYKENIEASGALFYAC